MLGRSAGVRSLMSSFAKGFEAVVLGPEAFKRMPWKNGKGVTTEIAIGFAPMHPDTFSWRISRATVSEDGDFSVFDGVDRNLTVLPGGGEGLELRVQTGSSTASSTLRPLEPFAFPGDVSTTGVLLGGVIDDFNVMARRGLARIDSVQLVDSTNGAAAANEYHPTVATGDADGDGGSIVIVYCVEGPEVTVAGPGALADDLVWSGGPRWVVPLGHAFLARSQKSAPLAVLGSGKCIRVDLTELEPAERPVAE